MRFVFKMNKIVLKLKSFGKDTHVVCVCFSTNIDVFPERFQVKYKTNSLTFTLITNEYEYLCVCVQQHCFSKWSSGSCDYTVTHKQTNKHTHMYITALNYKLLGWPSSTTQRLCFFLLLFSHVFTAACAVVVVFYMSVFTIFLTVHI